MISEEVILDVHEPEALKSYLRMNGISFKEESLSVGDLILGDKNLAERKTLGDLLKSQKEGRLYYQVKALSESRQEGFKPMLIIEGQIPRFSDETKGLWKRIQSIKLSLLALGIPSIEVRNKTEFLELLKLFIGRVGRPGGERPSLSYGKAKGKLSNMEIKVDILRTIPQIGYVKATQLIKKKGSIEEVIASLHNDKTGIEVLVGHKACQSLEDALIKQTGGE